MGKSSQAAAAVVVAPTKIQENLTVPFSSITIDLEFNSRTVYKNIPELAESIKSHGLITPLTVRKADDGSWYLVAGYRRYQALTLLNWGDKPVKVTMEDYETDGAAYLANIVENTARSDMNTVDLAKRFHELETGTYRRILKPLKEGEEAGINAKIPRKEIAKHSGFSVSHLSNLIRIHTKMSDTVKEMCQKHEIPMAKMFKWSAIEGEEEQLAAFEEWKSAVDAEKAEGKKPKSKKDKKDKDDEGDDEGDETETVSGPSKSEIKSQFAALDEKIKEGALKGEELLVAKTKHKTLRWVLGEIVRL